MDFSPCSSLEKLTITFPAECGPRPFRRGEHQTIFPFWDAVLFILSTCKPAQLKSVCLVMTGKQEQTEYHLENLPWGRLVETLAVLECPKISLTWRGEDPNPIFGLTSRMWTIADQRLSAFTANGTLELPRRLANNYHEHR